MRALLDDDAEQQQAILCLVDGFKYQYKVTMNMATPMAVLLSMFARNLVASHARDLIRLRPSTRFSLRSKTQFEE